MIEGNLFEVRDRRGQESEATRDPREQQVTAEAKIIPMRRCPNCKQNQHEGSYLFNPSLQFYVCLECGVVFMDVKFAKAVYKESIGGKKGVDVNPKKG